MNNKILFSAILMLALTACVPSKKYNELLEREKQCNEELESYKSRALTGEGKAAEFEAKYNVLTKEVDALKNDTTRLGNEYRELQAQYDKIVARVETLETTFDKYRLSGEKQTAMLQADLDAKSIELQRKQDELTSLENELKSKLQLLAEREQRVNELEEMIARQEQATKALKQKVANALKGFENRGLTVNEKNGKIYVSLEAKLLFASGSTKVEEEGKKALVELSKVLESEKDLEIIVEGHTDTDKLASASHPKNNWELSVLRATSVIEIMLANSKMNPKQLMAGGRSEFLPVDPNDKAKNRRIEIIISPNLSALFELIGG
ncbi:OmpA family protein [Crocinitomicaceae bacterium CZZ-1]|uniref:OmpA family protein n=1 Tax=Taishania pollutisoli TaxID=2766479 RepID=A0A8J6PCM4_9FLAO|nr:OmpA family protein [Taishania pollutisoli]MBC9812492.1 OmpA family protein [Taishania pollutisoli]MBX2949389.1 OmpA family protein [Crocinitomicaceae bacterium]NGF74468.1 OmpA family protein [Fluviicola sp. SGL-29]